jgi:hypothetical protein
MCPTVAVSEAAMDRTLEVQRLLAQHRGNGHRRPIPGLIIAATAELHGAEVLHVDSDYDLIAEGSQASQCGVCSIPATHNRADASCRAAARHEDEDQRQACR